MSWKLMFDDGRETPIDGLMVIGRAPLANEGDDVVVVDDKTVSKMHLVAYADIDGVSVTDTESTNGTMAGPKDALVRVEPGEPVKVFEGQTVRFGEREFIVVRVPDED